MERNSFEEIYLEIEGLGIIMYSPSYALHIAAEEDYLSHKYWEPDQVQEHVQAGTIVSFATGTPGRFFLKFYSGYPEREFIDSCEFRLRLAIRVIDEKIYVRDLYDLMYWYPQCPENQQVKIENGIYHITLCGNPPVSGILGGDQTINIFLSKLDEFPKLADLGVPQFVNWE